MRLYSFVAGLYLSPLQAGLQTAHAVSEMHANLINVVDDTALVFDDWAVEHKTIIICNAMNSKGVRDANTALIRYGAHFDLPAVMFCEDEDSLNGAPTAAAIVVPEKYYNVRFLPAFGDLPMGYEHLSEDGKSSEIYLYGSLEYEFIAFLKSYRLV